MKRIFSSSNEREARRLQPVVQQINALCDEMDALSDDDLRRKTAEFRARLATGASLDDLMPEAYAAVKQVCKRKTQRQERWIAAGNEIVWEMVPYDVQIIGAIALHRGKIAEMATGEGKTLVAVMPLYLNALPGKGVHLVTVNDYLALRDAQWNGPIFEALGMSVGCIQTDMPPPERRLAYAADITYGTNNEFGFDYLRDNMATRPEYVVQGTPAWQSGDILRDLQQWSEQNEAQLVLALPYAITLDISLRKVRDLLDRFADRFGVDQIVVSVPEDSDEALRASLDGSSDRLGGTRTGARGIAPGQVHAQISFLRHGHHYAIVDEVDSVLIDEARTPLIISGAVDRSTHRYDTIKPMVTELVRKQTALVTRLVNEAEKLIAEDPHSYDAGLKFFQCHLAAPKNKRYLKNRAEGFVQRLVQKVENDHILWKKNAKVSDAASSDPLARVEADLYYVIDEKGHSIDLTEKGREALNPADPDYFVLPDIVEETEKVEGRHHPEIELLLENEPMTRQQEEALIAKLRREQEDFRTQGLSESIDYEKFIARIEANEALSENEREEFEATMKQAGEFLKARMREDHERKAEELHNISQLLRAYSLFEKDVEYVIEENKVIIVDEFTGRKMPGRRFTDGLHQALEAKENVHIEKETQTLATITLQNYFRMYTKLAGMTGTAETEASEFAHTYKMDVQVIPTNKPISRKDLDDIIYRTRKEKYEAAIAEIERLHKLNLPVLVGTVSVEVSETLSRLLRRRGISHNVLNAKNHGREAEIVREAGQPGQVTIATNMAGRGTDIKLGPGVREIRKDPETGENWLGGLQIVGTERHDARRIDRQLRGRSGRQGDPGTSRFFVSLEDDLMRKFMPESMPRILERLGLREGDAIEHPFVTKAITRAQKRMEEHNFEIRKKTLEYDNVMNKQRTAIYGLRRQVLEGLGVKEAALNVSYDAMAAEIENFAGEEKDKDFAAWDLEGFLFWVRRAIPFIDLTGIEPRAFGDPDDLVSAIMPKVDEAYEIKNEHFGPRLHNDIARWLILHTIDDNWRDHLLAIDELREGVHLRSYAQLDPLVEYQREATLLFNEMMTAINKQIFTRLYKASLVQSQPGGPVDLDFKKEDFDPRKPPQQQGGGAEPPKPRITTYRRDTPKVLPNEPCPCGSGLKYKRCCGSPNGPGSPQIKPMGPVAAPAPSEQTPPPPAAADSDGDENKGRGPRRRRRR